MRIGPLYVLLKLKKYPRIEQFINGKYHVHRDPVRKPPEGHDFGKNLPPGIEGAS